MADPNDKVPGQARGRYYVDSQCIDCDLCRETAPANFMRNDEQGFSYVFKQPESEEEETLCKDALDNCPVEAIGNDGGDEVSGLARQAPGPPAPTPDT